MRFLSAAMIILASITTLVSQFSIQGHITNKHGEGLDFATVFLEGTRHAASSDARGLYQIKDIPPGNYVLKVLFIGYRQYIEEIVINTDLVRDIKLEGEIYNLDLIEIQANRVGNAGPYSRTSLDKITIQKNNNGQDVPYVLQWTPSLLVTSDAGAGIGYTGMRLRGSDQTRINVTLNGVPVNDAESHNVFWVDLPDLTGSVNHVEIQRGTGPSTNGPGAFGGTVSITTADTRVNPFLDISASAGSFGTGKLSVSAGSGLINNRCFVEGRYSLVKSDGYIDRASADLSSLYFSAARVTAKSSLRFNVFSGREVTYQAWYGVPEAKLTGDTEGLFTHYYNNLGVIYKSTTDSVNLFSSGRQYNYYTYPNQVDNYRQNHLQLIHSLAINNRLRTKVTAFYTMGKGYFEEYRYGDNPASYLIPDYLDASGTPVTSTNLVRQRWLDNDLLGASADFSLVSKNGKLKTEGGVTAMNYLGDHYGNLIRIDDLPPGFSKERKYYLSNSDKKDMSAYIRWEYQPATAFTLTADLQGRLIHYKSDGTDNDQQSIAIDYQNSFFNPKFGFNYVPVKNSRIFMSWSLAHKEPVRSDFVDHQGGMVPRAEKMSDLELGFSWATQRIVFESNMYYMKYKNQLVLTGDLNDVGAPLRINVPDSYRLGLETSARFLISKKFSVLGQATFSRNKIDKFTEVVADYTNGFERVLVSHTNTDISFSPSFTAYAVLVYKPVERLEAEWMVRYAGKQFLDNTSDPGRSIKPYNYHNVRLALAVNSRYWKSSRLSLFANNILDSKYSANGYTYTYIYGSRITENFYYPQAGRNYLLTLELGF